MSEKRTTARAFHDAEGVEDWRVLFSGAGAQLLDPALGEVERLVEIEASSCPVAGVA